MGRMVEMFPNLLSLDTDAQIMPVLYFLQVTPLKPLLEVEVGCSRVQGYLLGSHAVRAGVLYLSA